MNREEIRLCEYCHCIIPKLRNRNSKFCNNHCYDSNKANLAAKAQKEKAAALITLNNDEILHGLYLKYESKYYISAKDLIDRGFNWSIFKEESTINNLPVKLLIRYAYTLFNNQNVQLWKL